MSPDQDPAYTLPADAYYHLVRALRLTLPPPPSNAPDALARRDRAAIAQIAALQPASTAEAELAGQFVAASEQWKDCLRLAQNPETPPDLAMKCRAQAASMMRQANSAMRVLLRLQAARWKTEANPETCNRADRAERFTALMLAEALAEPAVPPNEESRETEIETPVRLPVRLPAAPRGARLRAASHARPDRDALLNTSCLGARSPGLMPVGACADRHARGVGGAAARENISAPPPQRPPPEPQPVPA